MKPLQKPEEFRDWDLEPACTVLPEEITLFFLAAMTALDLDYVSACHDASMNNDIEYRWHYWQDDPRVVWISDDQPPLGLPVKHPLAIDAFQDWLFKKQR